MIDKYVYQMKTETGNTNLGEGGDPTAKSSIITSFLLFIDLTQLNLRWSTTQSAPLPAL